MDGVWYAVTTDRMVNDRLIVNGTVHLILGDGVTLTVPEGVTFLYKVFGT